MKKALTGFLVLCAVLLGSLAFAPTASADNYGDCASQGANCEVSPPSVVSDNSDTTPSGNLASNGTLPNTGGPNAVLLYGAIALIVVGGATVLVVRRRPQS